MRTSTRYLTCLAATVAAAALAGATSAAADGGAIVFRVTAVPEFLDGTATCPLFRADGPVETPSGAPMGSFEFCFATFDADASGHVDATGTASFSLAGGTIAATLHLVELPTGNGNVVQFDSGTVTGGTGAYTGASGVWHATGPIRFDPDGTPHPKLLYVISLR